MNPDGPDGFIASQPSFVKRTIYASGLTYIRKRARAVCQLSATKAPSQQDGPALLAPMFWLKGQ